MIKNILWILLTLIVLFFLDLWIEYSSNGELFFNTFIEPVIDGISVPLIIPFLIVVACVGVFIDMKRRHDSQINDLTVRLNSEMELLITTNQEFSKYRLQDVLTSKLKSFVSRNPYVLSVQFYSFEEKNLNSKSLLKLNFNSGYVSSIVSVNSIQQLIQHVELKKLKEFRKAKKELLEQDSPFKLTNFALDIFNELKVKSSLNEEDIASASLMVLSFEILEKNLSINLLDSLEEDHKNIIEEVYTSRTGLMRAAIMGDSFYTFSYHRNRDTEKINRQYLAALIDLKGEQTLFSIILDGSILTDDYEIITDEIRDNFELLLNELEEGYNNSTERLGGHNE